MINTSVMGHEVRVFGLRLRGARVGAKIARNVKEDDNNSNDGKRVLEEPLHGENKLLQLRMPYLVYRFF